MCLLQSYMKSIVVGLDKISVFYSFSDGLVCKRYIYQLPVFLYNIYKEDSEPWLISKQVVDTVFVKSQRYRYIQTHSLDRELSVR